MSDFESRSLGRVAVFLLAASLLRLAFATRSEPAPPPGQDLLGELLAESRGRAAEAARRSSPLGAGERIDPNRATAAELDRLPGVGPALAEALVRSREAEGPFRTREDLLRVRGIGPVLLGRIEPHLALSPAPPSPARPRTGARSAPVSPSSAGKGSPLRTAPLLDLNRADTVALQALPGVGPALARRIVEARTASRFRSVDDLLKVRGIGPATLTRLRPFVTVSP